MWHNGKFGLRAEILLTMSEENTYTDEITYHAVEKDGVVTAIWEMQGRKHLRTIDPRSRMGQQILQLYTADHEDVHGDALHEAA